jgi:hypothetical protein
MLPTPDYARNMRLIGHSDQGGRPDGVRVTVHRGHACVGHMFSKGFSVVDVRDPNAKDMVADLAFAGERAYYSGSSPARSWSSARTDAVRP